MAEMELAGVNLPYSLDAEQSVLGAILLDGNANMPKASAKLHPEHFYVKVHTDIYTVMMPVSYTHLDVYKRQTLHPAVIMTTAVSRRICFSTDDISSSSLPPLSAML